MRHTNAENQTVVASNPVLNKMATAIDTRIVFEIDLDLCSFEYRFSQFTIRILNCKTPQTRVDLISESLAEETTITDNFFTSHYSHTYSSVERDLKLLVKVSVVLCFGLEDCYYRQLDLLV